MQFLVDMQYQRKNITRQDYHSITTREREDETIDWLWTTENFYEHEGVDTYGLMTQLMEHHKKKTADEVE